MRPQTGYHVIFCEVDSGTYYCYKQPCHVKQCFHGGNAGCCIDDTGLGDTVNEESAQLNVGETQVLELSGNPTTGYTWLLAEPLPPNYPVSVEIDYTSTPTKRPLTGRGGIFKVKYTGLTPGSATVKLIYARPWARDATQNKKIHLNITVK